MEESTTIPNATVNGTEAEKAAVKEMAGTWRIKRKRPQSLLPVIRGIIEADPELREKLLQRRADLKDEDAVFDAEVDSLRLMWEAEPDLVTFSHSKVLKATKHVMNEGFVDQLGGAAIKRGRLTSGVRMHLRALTHHNEGTDIA